MTLEQKIENIVKPICASNNLYLVEVHAKGNIRNPVFQVFADSEKGITLGQCEVLTRLIKDEIDMDDSISGNYRLDVSSPGLDRPLVQDFEFKKNIGQTLVVKIKTPESEKKITGKLIGFDSQTLQVEEGDQLLTIQRADIDQAKVKIQW